jgi:DNA-binding transcriptional MerR regulator
MTTGSYTSKQIVQLTGVGIRTYRHWIGLGFLASARGRGPGARYGVEQLDRVRVVQALRAQGAGLDEIKRRLSVMTPEQMAALIPPPPSPPAPPSPSPPPPPPQPSVATVAPTDVVSESASSTLAPPAGYRATAWETVELMPGLLLMVAQNRGDLVRRLAHEIYRSYGTAVR